MNDQREIHINLSPLIQHCMPNSRLVLLIALAFSNRRPYQRCWRQAYGTGTNDLHQGICHTYSVWNHRSLAYCIWPGVADGMHVNFFSICPGYLGPRCSMDLRNCCEFLMQMSFRHNFHDDRGSASDHEPNWKHTIVDTLKDSLTTAWGPNVRENSGVPWIQLCHPKALGFQCSEVPEFQGCRVPGCSRVQGFHCSSVPFPIPVLYVCKDLSFQVGVNFF